MSKVLLVYRAVQQSPPKPSHSPSPSPTLIFGDIHSFYLFWVFFGFFLLFYCNIDTNEDLSSPFPNYLTQWSFNYSRKIVCRHCFEAMSCHCCAHWRPLAQERIAVICTQLSPLCWLRISGKARISDISCKRLGKFQEINALYIVFEVGLLCGLFGH